MLVGDYIGDYIGDFFGDLSTTKSGDTHRRLIEDKIGDNLVLIY